MTQTLGNCFMLFAPMTRCSLFLFMLTVFNSLSGLSPFLGDDDNETLNNILRCQWNFEECEFSGISDEAKDFISKLLVYNKRSVHLSIHPSIRLSIYPSIHPSTQLSIYLFIYPPTHLPIHPPIHPIVYLSIHLLGHPPIHLLIYQPIHPST